MKTLILIRHAKAIQDITYNDIDRKLTSRGIENAKQVGKESKKIIKQNHVFITSSTAERAFHTAKLIVDEWTIDKIKIRLNAKLYTFDRNDLEKIIKNSSNEFDTVILFGHNSAITDFVNKFGDIYIENVPTSGLVSIIFDSENWHGIKKGKTETIIFPSSIKL